MILWQCVLDHIFMRSTETKSSSKEGPRDGLTSIEDNTVRYTAGFLVHELMEKYKDGISGDYMHCLE